MNVRIAHITLPFLVTLCILCIHTQQVYAGKTPAPELTMGIKGTAYKSDNSGNIYTSPYLQGDYKLSAVTFELDYSYTYHYQLIDTNENYQTATLHSLSAGIEYNFATKLYCNVEALIQAGDYAYLRQNYFGSIDYDFDFLTLAFEYSYDKTSYTINDETITISSGDTTADLSYYLREYTSLDLSYTYHRTDSTLRDSIYTKNSFRIGLSSALTSSMFIMGGVVFSRDSGDYSGIGPDIGITLYFSKNTRLYLLYSFMYYHATGSSTETQDADGVIISSDESYQLHMFSFGFSQRFL